MEENCHVVKLRGLPWSTTPPDVVKFLEDCKLLKDEEGIHLLKFSDGRSSGEAFVELMSSEDESKALLLNKKHIGKRYIDVFKVKQSDMQHALKRDSNSGQGPEAVVRLRGLPFGCSKEEIANFFLGLEIAPNGINILTDHVGRCTGDSYVQFLSAESVPVALTKNKRNIQHRYVEVFQSSLDEMMSALARSMHINENMALKRQGARYPPPQFFTNGPLSHRYYDTGFGQDSFRSGGFNPPSLFSREIGRYNRPFDKNISQMGGTYPRNLPPRIANLATPQKRQFLGGYTNNSSPQQYSSVTGHTVHMRGLPYSTTKEEIAQFFFPLSPVNVSLEYNSSGRPSGDANVDFETRSEAQEAMKKNKNLIKKRYIELFLRSASHQGSNGTHNFQGQRGYSSFNRMAAGDYMSF